MHGFNISNTRYPNSRERVLQDDREHEYVLQSLGQTHEEYIQKRDQILARMHGPQPGPGMTASEHFEAATRTRDRGSKLFNLNSYLKALSSMEPRDILTQEHAERLKTILGEQGPFAFDKACTAHVSRLMAYDTLLKKLTPEQSNAPDEWRHAIIPGICRHIASEFKAIAPTLAEIARKKHGMTRKRASAIRSGR